VRVITLALHLTENGKAGLRTRINSGRRGLLFARGCLREAVFEVYCTGRIDRFWVRVTCMKTAYEVQIPLKQIQKLEENGS
jgi:hypothetical protein